jgi:Ni,Fe-hydrogenase I cytochrome b subunit
MSNEYNDEIEGKMSLSHDPVPGYKTFFYIAMTVGVLYLGFILYKTL